MGRHDEDGIRPIKSHFCPFMPQSPGSLRALRGPRAFGDRMRNAESLRDTRTDPVRRL